VRSDLREAPEKVRGRRQRHLGLGLVPDHVKVRQAAGTLRHLRQEARLPAARIADDHGRRRAVLCTREDGLQNAELLGSADEGRHAESVEPPTGIA
jgi:hypothetical protein